MSIEVLGCNFPEIIAKCPILWRDDNNFARLKPTMQRSEIEKISKALADKTRLRIFEAISATDHMNCGEIVSMRGVTRATVSHHLKILNEAGLIACRREGQFVYSEAVPDTVAAYTQALAKIVRGGRAARRG